MNVLWVERAEADLNGIFDYLIDEEPAAAVRIYGLINERASLLAQYPGLGRPGRIVGTRELVIPQTPYVVAYTVDLTIGAVIMLRVLHGAREWPAQP